jgi:4a-hydroxytetrahydrobiopterin dehydratase
LRLSGRRIKLELTKTGGWRLRGKYIWRLFIFEDFAQSMRFVNRVAMRAESMNHHPDMLVQYNKVKLVLTTHDSGGLTMKDFTLARKINRIRR